MTQISIKLFGPWFKVKRLMNDLPSNLKTIATASQRSLAEKFVRKIKAHLINQDIPGWTPLSSRYADYKMGKYGHEDILIASWDYYNNIKAWRENGIYNAGVPKGVLYPNGREIARIAEIHESWSYMSGKPHRPLWSYTINQDMGGNLGMKKMVNKILKEKLREKGYPLNSFTF